MQNSINTKIITPFKNEFKGEATYIEVPTFAGIIGILPNHIATISSLAKGILKITTNEGVYEFEVTEGFIRFNNNVCLISLKEVKKIHKVA